MSKGNRKTWRPRSAWRVVLAAVLVGFVTGPLAACPFCGALSSTLTQDIAYGEAAYLGVFVGGDSGEELGVPATIRFRLEQPLKGAAQPRGTVVQMISDQEFEPGQVALLLGVREEHLWEWGAVGPLTPEAQQHIRKLMTLPPSGKERMEYFLPLLTSDQKRLADDAYNEFAIASLADMQTLRDSLDRQQVIATLQDDDTPLERRRLYWTLLSICGTGEQLPIAIDAIMQRLEEEDDRFGLDSAVSCAMVLGGAEALDRIDQLILANPQAEYSDVSATVLAIRVHGTEYKQIPRERLLESLRHVLARPPVADLVIPDLARWEDWSQIDRLQELFVNADAQTQFLREPVVRYLQACPLPAAKEALQRCREVDPDAVRRATTIFRPRRSRS